jgi:hypothetical protein
MAITIPRPTISVSTDSYGNHRVSVVGATWLNDYFSPNVTKDMSLANKRVKRCVKFMEDEFLRIESGKITSHFVADTMRRKGLLYSERKMDVPSDLDI